uniref:CSON003144 protein n=1 Tax=Culicoides sonorensis TaxID=179676 RepID=A0A336L4G5_CULSO
MRNINNNLSWQIIFFMIFHHQIKVNCLLNWTLIGQESDSLKIFIMQTISLIKCEIGGYLYKALYLIYIIHIFIVSLC